MNTAITLFKITPRACNQQQVPSMHLILYQHSCFNHDTDKFDHIREGQHTAALGQQRNDEA